MSEVTGRIERKIALSAAEKRMTAGELRRFTAELDTAGVPDDTQVKASVAISGYLRKIEV